MMMYRVDFSQQEIDWNLTVDEMASAASASALPAQHVIKTSVQCEQVCQLTQSMMLEIWDWRVLTIVDSAREDLDPDDDYDPFADEDMMEIQYQFRQLPPPR